MKEQTKNEIKEYGIARTNNGGVRGQMGPRMLRNDMGGENYYCG